MVEIGKYQKLNILRETSVGIYLGDGSGEDILLPHKYCPEPGTYDLGDELEVFVYLDYAERKIATNLTPKILLHEFALLQVVDIGEVGAFLDWGLEKHLMVPFREQRQKMEEGRWYIVFMDIDWETERLYATNKIEKRLQNEFLSVEEGEEVTLLIIHKTDLGFNVIVNDAHKGLIYDNEIFQEINIGDKLKGFVKKIRAGNKLDVSLYPIGYVHANDANVAAIYQSLLDNKGFISLTDKSTPDEIYAQFRISKKAFKKAIGALYKQRKITIGSDGIRIL